MGVLDPPGARRDALLTDLYQLTMAAAYWQAGVRSRSTFELFTRRLEADRGFYLACGLELALDHLEGLRFEGDQVDWLRRLPVFAATPPGFFEWLRELRFRGDVHAMPEGTPFFPDEPVLRVTADVIEAQLVETYLLSVINQQSLIATKAARIARAARGKHVSDFGTRRAHGPEAGALAARAGYVGGCASTSNVEAGHRLGIPVIGTFAHSWVMAFDDEAEAFKRYLAAFPGATTLLIDTYDPLAAARKAVALGPGVGAVRLDSGDLAALSREVRSILDQGGLGATRIVASGDLNERKIDLLERQAAPIDVYGVGTDLAVSRDQPALGGVYKLVERVGPDGRAVPTFKLSKDKRTWPGAKQVWRRDGKGDVLGLAGEPAPADARPLLEPVLQAGKRLRPPPPLEAARARAAQELARLPDGVRALEQPERYPVSRSAALERLADELLEKASRRPGGAS